MAKDPAFLFYSSDFYMGTVGMTDAQVGQYIRLMCLQHQQGHLSKSVISSVTGGKDDPVLMTKFLQDEDGLYYSKRLDEETNKRRDYSESRAKNRKGNDISKSYVNHMSNISDSYVEHMVNENEDVNINTIRTPIVLKNELFDSFWKAYPNKKSKETAKKAWAKIKPDDALLETMLKAIELQKGTPQWQKNGGEFIPLPASWLNQKRWEDEIKNEVRPSAGKRVNFQLYDQTKETAQPEGMPDLLAEARAWAAEQKEVAL